MIRLQDLLLEDGAGGQTPSEQAAALGLVYGGFAQWVDPQTRKTMARTVNGKLVRVDNDDEESDDTNKGKLVVFNFDPGVLHAEKNKVPEQKVKAYRALMDKMLKFGGELVVFTARSQERDVAIFLKEMGIVSGVKLVPFATTDPQKKRKFVEKKIKEGFKEIVYCDYNPRDIATIQSLKAPYNKKNIKIDTIEIPEVGDVSAAEA